MFNQYNPMMYQGFSRPFSFSNILNGAQKTLNIINQTIPVVKEVRPIFKNARTLFNVAKGFSEVNNNNNDNKEDIPKKTISNNGPNFFI